MRVHGAAPLASWRRFTRARLAVNEPKPRPHRPAAAETTRMSADGVRKSTDVEAMAAVGRIIFAVV